MKGRKLVRNLICVLLALTMVFTPTVSTKAATATKVTKKYVYNSKTYKQYTILKGKTSKGKTVWTYKSKTTTATELDCFSYTVKGSYVYCMDYDTYVRIKKSTGKVVAKKKISTDLASPKMYIDSSKNMYAMGYYGSKVWKINSSGKVKWKTKVSSDYYWPTKISKSGSNIAVKFDGYKGGTLKFKMSNGKLVK